MPTIPIKISGAEYDVEIEPRQLARAGERITRIAAGRRCFVVTNSIVWKHWGKALSAALKPQPFETIRVPAGEKHKNIVTATRICEELVKLGADRGSVLIAFGGGVIGDVAGFVAAIFLRGVDYVQIPTTLLAQIDSSVGGKTGVNLRSGKNLVGAFHHPRYVLADPEVLRTLPERELRAGLYEAIKCGVIRRPELFEFIETNRERLMKKDATVLSEMVRQCVAIKASVVIQDERESGLRRILNFGHTAGHALEAETKYKRFLHGEAVAWGMRAATMIAEERGLLPKAGATRIHTLIRDFGKLPPLPRIPPARLSQRLLADKKTRAGVVHFVLPERIGSVRIVDDVAVEAVSRALEQLRRE